MRLAGTKLAANHQYRGFGDQLYDLAGERPSLDLNFANTKTLTDSATSTTPVTFTRASSGTYVDSQGVIRTATTNEARFNHNPTTGESLGLLVEEQRTNSIRNNTMVGAVAGTPGIAPTNWSIGGNSGLTYSVIGTGADNGIQYIDIRFNGTTAAVAAPEATIGFEPSTAVAAVQNQTWTGSAYVKIVGGSLNGILGGELFVIENNISGNLTGASSSIYSYSQLTGALPNCRVSHTRTLAGATTAFVTNRVDINFTAGGGSVVDCTLRIGLPQLELGAFPTSVIPTTTAAVTRSADVASITGSNFSSWYRQDEGTVFISARTNATHGGVNSFPRIYAISDGANDNVIQNYYRVLSGYTDAGYRVTTLTVAQASFETNNERNGQSLSTAYANNDFAFVINGSLVSTDNTGTVPTISQLRLGAIGTGLNPLNGTIRRLTYWPQRLPNSTLQQITQ